MHEKTLYTDPIMYHACFNLHDAIYMVVTWHISEVTSVINEFLLKLCKYPNLQSPLRFQRSAHCSRVYCGDVFGFSWSLQLVQHDCSQPPYPPRPTSFTCTPRLYRASVTCTRTDTLRLLGKSLA